MPSRNDPPHDPRHWQAAMALVEALLDLPEAQRAAALARAAAPAEVGALSRQLLDAHQQASILDAPLSQELTPPSRPGHLAGRRLGRWLLTDLLGEGGMSVVYRARSLAPPIGQESAVKLLSMAAATEAGRARFEREIHILVRLRHPGIAPVIDAGVAEDGTPWFAMALVEGIDIATWCREQGLDIRQRVDLLLQVCDAVAHAHRHLVIHRDIKPSNVLVDREGRAILLDFGISRILEEGRAEITSTGTYAFTPRYAAPEQIDGGTITTATDVYGLGSLLHLLLLGAAPQFPPGMPDGECIDPAAIARRSDDRELRKALSGDLGAVLRKALSRGPERRHAGAAELGADLAAWRDGRPVTARRDNTAYRLQRFVMRHRAATALAAAFVLALAGGLWLSLSQRAAAIAAAERATASEASARQQLDFLQGLLLDLSPARDMPASIPREQLLAMAEAQARKELGEDPSALAQILATLATIHSQAGRRESATELLEEANRIAPPTMDDIDGLVREMRLIEARILQQPRTTWDDAITRLAEIEAAVSRFRPGSGDHLSVLSRLTGAQIATARYDDADAANTRAFEQCPDAGRRFCTAIESRQSDILWNQGRIDESTAMKDALWQRGDLEQSMPAGEYATFMQRYAQALEAAGRYDDADELVDRILERHGRIHEGPTVTSVVALERKARIQYERNQLEDAFATIERGIADAFTVEGEDSVRALHLRATRIKILQRMGRKDAVDAELEALLPRMRSAYGDDHPRVLDLAARRATNLADAGHAAEAIELLHELIARMEASKPPGSRQVAQLRLRLARLLLGHGDPVAADAAYVAALPAYRDKDGASTAKSLVIDAERGEVLARLGQNDGASRAILGSLDALRSGHYETSDYVTILIKAISITCQGQDTQACEALRAEGRAVIARDLPTHRHLFSSMAEAMGA